MCASAPEETSVVGVEEEEETSVVGVEEDEDNLIQNQLLVPALGPEVMQPWGPSQTSSGEEIFQYTTDILNAPLGLVKIVCCLSLTSIIVMSLITAINLALTLAIAMALSLTLCMRYACMLHILPPTH